MATLNISLPDTMRRWVDEQVESGHFANASDYIRDLIRYDLSERDYIRAAIAKGEASGRSEKTARQILEEIRAARS